MVLRTLVYRSVRQFAGVATSGSIDQWTVTLGQVWEMHSLSGIGRFIFIGDCVAHPVVHHRLDVISKPVHFPMNCQDLFNF